MGIHVQRTDVIVRDRAPIYGSEDDIVEYSGQFFLNTTSNKIYYGIAEGKRNEWIELSSNRAEFTGWGISVENISIPNSKIPIIPDSNVVTFAFNNDDLVKFSTAYATAGIITLDTSKLKEFSNQTKINTTEIMKLKANVVWLPSEQEDLDAILATIKDRELEGGGVTALQDMERADMRPIFNLVFGLKDE